MNIDIDLLIQDKSWKTDKNINKQLMRDIFNLVMNYLKISLDRFHNIEFSVNLSNDKHIQKLNKEYRNKDKPTNVLTFSIYENKKDIKKDLKTLPCIALGDIIFSYNTIKKEAEEQNKTFLNHFIHMLVHSYLHLFAYDHIKDNERKRMEKMEIEILKSIDIDNPYIIK